MIPVYLYGVLPLTYKFQLLSLWECLLVIISSTSVVYDRKVTEFSERPKRVQTVIIK